MAYSQNDPTWKNTLLGFNTSTWTIGNSGCYVTAIANVCRWAGNDLTPLQVNQVCKDNRWFVNGGEISRDDIPALLSKNLEYLGRTDWSGPTDINFFDDASDPNVAYIIKIDASPAAGIQSHFTMVWAKPDASDLQIDDSWDGVRKALSRYGKPSTVILAAMKFRKIAPPTPPPAPSFTVTVDPIDKTIVVLPGHNKWNLDLPTFNDIVANPAPLPITMPITIKGLLHRSDLPNYAYYVEDLNSHQGYNTLDCVDYVAPVYTPPAAPVEAIPARKYHTNFVVPIYPNEQAARSRDVSTSQAYLAIDDYFVFAEAGKALNLSKDNNHDQQIWINILDDVQKVETPPPVIAEPTPEPAPSTPTPEAQLPIDSTSKIMQSHKWFFKDHRPVTYRIRKDCVVREYVHGRNAMTIKAGKKIDIYGAFQVNGKTYLRPLLESDIVNHRYYYGIETTDMLSGFPYLEDVSRLEQGIQAGWEWILEHLTQPKKVIDGIFKIKLKP